MKSRFVRHLSLALGLLALGTPAFAAGTGAPFVYKSAPTDDGTPPASARLSPGARLAASDTGRYVVAFAKDDGSDASYVFLGFTFSFADKPAPYAVTVAAEKAVASIHVFANGTELQPVSGSSRDWAVVQPAPGRQEIVVRLERGSSRLVPMTLLLRGFDPTTSLSPNPAGAILDAPPKDLVWDLGGSPGEPSGRGDVFVPAVIRSEGLHGPIRSRLAMLNHTAATVRVFLSLLSSEGGPLDAKSIDLAPRATTVLDDVVGYVRGGDAMDQGVLAVRGFAPASPGDLVAETSYVDERGGRIGTTLPVFAESPARSSNVILSASPDGEPRLILFSDASRLGPATPRTARVRVETASGRDDVTSITFLGGTSVTKRLSEILSGSSAGSVIAVETDDPSIHAFLVRNDPTTGSPFVYASN